MTNLLLASLAIFIAQILLIAEHVSPVAAFAPTVHTTSPLKSHHALQTSCNNRRRHQMLSPLASSPEDNNVGVIDLTDDDDEDAPVAAQVSTPAAPFLSQGELSDDPNLLSPDFKDAKQTRVIIYIILTLVPILFLVPLMIGSRDLIPLDTLPPVEMNDMMIL
ncbi:hypothetical protein ACHAXR_010252 [Thalassiosira sp. AJA248-18]